ncbi:MAG TPA: flagellar biosynthesis protein FlgB [Acetobacteraceae bacterium]|nr:flagellar biosynthesis protein FlgB [Acetobacteraceae bacterium]
MDPTDIGLFRLAERRLAWVDQRQALLAQNVANAYTPGFKPRDLASFAATLNQQAGVLARTDPQHLSGSGGQAQVARSRPFARSPDGNAVSLEQELGKVADTSSTQELVSNLYHKYQGLFRTALGRNG